MNQKDIAAELRKSADLIEQRAAPSVVPDISVRSACERLAHLPTIGIDLKVDNYRGDGWRVQWEIWDGEKHHSSPSLATAVQLVLAAHDDEKTTVESVDDALGCPSSDDQGLRRALTGVIR